MELLVVMICMYVIYVYITLQMFQVLYGEKPMYIHASNCVEASEWIEVLSRVSRRNHRRLSRYHPSAFINGTWLCCKASSESTEGCSPCTV